MARVAVMPRRFQVMEKAVWKDEPSNIATPIGGRRAGPARAGRWSRTPSSGGGPYLARPSRCT